MSHGDPTDPVFRRHRVRGFKVPDAYLEGPHRSPEPMTAKQAAAALEANQPAIDYVMSTIGNLGGLCAPSLLTEQTIADIEPGDPPFTMQEIADSAHKVPGLADTLAGLDTSDHGDPPKSPGSFQPGLQHRPDRCSECGGTQVARACYMGTNDRMVYDLIEHHGDICLHCPGEICIIEAPENSTMDPEQVALYAELEKKAKA